MDEANTALAARPSRHAEAHGAFERAVAANDDAAAVSEAWFRLGALDEEDGEFASAVTHYQQSVAARPADSAVPWPRNASSRLRWLRMHAEGNFAPLARLSRFKRDPVHATDAEAIAALARDAEGFPDGAVRAEALVLVATAWLGPLHRPGDAIREFRLVTADPSADGTARRFAERGLVDALIADGQMDEAIQEAEIHAAQLDPMVVSRLHRIQRRGALLRIVRIDVAVFAVAGAGYLWWCRRRTALRGERRTHCLSIVARVAGALWAAASLVAAAVIVIGIVAPSCLDHIGI